MPKEPYFYYNVVSRNIPLTQGRFFYLEHVIAKPLAWGFLILRKGFQFWAWDFLFQAQGLDLCWVVLEWSPSFRQGFHSILTLITGWHHCRCEPEWESVSGSRMNENQTFFFKIWESDRFFHSRTYIRFSRSYGKLGFLNSSHWLGKGRCCLGLGLGEQLLKKHELFFFLNFVSFFF